MKAVQVGILVALVVVAGLLFLVYKQQQSTAPQPVPQAATAAAPVAAEAPPAQPAPAAAPQSTPPPAPAEAKPARAWRKASAAPKPSKAAPPPAESASAAAPPTPAPASTPPAAPQTPPAQAPVPAEPPPQPPVSPLSPPRGTETAPREPHRVTIPAGTLISVRLGETVSTERHKAGDAFSANLDQPLVLDGFVIAERGARVEGRVLEAQEAGRVRGTAMLAIHLIKLHTSDGQEVSIHTQKFVKEGETTRREDATKVGAGAAIGAAIGAIAGGGKGAAVGAAVGGAAGAGTVAATRGKPAMLPSETRLSFRLEEAVTLTEKIR